MQYTGLKDKNGEEIYEGDIVHINMGRYEASTNSLGMREPAGTIEYDRIVEWIGTGLSWKGSGTMLRKGAENHFKVIGNIHENPELLK